MYKFIRLSLLFGLFILVASITETNAQDGVGQILRRMDAHNKVLQSLFADTEMVKYDSTLKDFDKPILGRVQYLAKSKQAKNKRWIRIDWKNPDEHMSLIGNEFTLYRPRIPQVIKSTSQGKGAAKFGTVLSFINMSKAELQANYEPPIYWGEEKIKGGTWTWHLQLNPLKVTDYKTVDLWIDPDGMPRQVKITYLNNDSTTILLSNLEKNKTVNLKSFEIDYPKNIKPTPA